MKLGNTLKRSRFDHDEITQQALANAVGVTRLTIHSIETGKFIPSTYLALRLALFFGKQVEDLFYLLDDGLPDDRDPLPQSGGDHGKKN